MSFGQTVDRVRRKRMTLERHDIDTTWPGRGTFAQHKRRHVVQHAAQAADEAVAANRREVMHGDGSAERSVVIDMHVAAEQRTICHDDVVAELAVVSDVATGHEEVAIAK